LPTPADPRASAARQVGHEPEALSDVRRADARSAQTDRRDGESKVLQVSANSADPVEANRCFNLFTKENSRSALADELAPNRPEVTLV
jgi:hypothetical protein